MAVVETNVLIPPKPVVNVVNVVNSFLIGSVDKFSTVRLVLPGCDSKIFNALRFETEQTFPVSFKEAWKAPMGAIKDFSTPPSAVEGKAAKDSSTAHMGSAFTTFTTFTTGFDDIRVVCNNNVAGGEPPEKAVFATYLCFSIARVGLCAAEGPARW